MSRVAVRKTYKLYIGGAFPRSESGRTYEAEGQNVAWASRKDARDAVKAARGAFAKWSGATPYNRGQVLYRLAEMMETRATDLARACSGRREVERAIDRVVWYAGWADKLPQVLGGSNPVAGPYFNFTVPEPTGVVAVLAPELPALEGLVSRIAPVIVSGNTAVVVTSETRPLAALELAEAIATSDLPGGVVNLLTGYRAELAPILASHMDVNAIDVTGAGDDTAALEVLAADNVKRVVRAHSEQSPWEISAFLELKTVWHPVGTYAGLPSGQQLIHRARALLQPRRLRPFDEHPRRPARCRPLEVPLVHPVPLLLELPDPVVLPRHLDPAHEVEVVAPLEQLVEGVGRLAEVDLVEQRRRERVGVAEEDLARRAGERVLVPALDPRDVGELVARPRRVGIASDLGVGPPELRVPDRVVLGRQRLGEGRLPGRFGTEQADALDWPGHRRSLRHPQPVHRDDGCSE